MGRLEEEVLEYGSKEWQLKHFTAIMIRMLTFKGVCWVSVKWDGGGRDFLL